MFEKPIRDILIADATLVSLVGLYAGLPKVLTDPIPEDVELPFIVLSGPIADESFETVGDILGREVLYDIRVHADRIGSSVAQVTTLAERVRTVLHRQSVPVAGLSWVTTRMSGPIVSDDEESFGRVLTARLLYSAP